MTFLHKHRKNKAVAKTKNPRTQIAGRNKLPKPSYKTGLLASEKLLVKKWDRGP